MNKEVIVDFMAFGESVGADIVYLHLSCRVVVEFQWEFAYCYVP